MRRDYKGVKILVLLLTATLLIALVVVELQDREEKGKRSEVLERAAPLEQQRDALVLRRDQRQREYYDEVRVQATEQILFLELDERLYSEVFPLMREQELTGVLGLSQQEFPDAEGRISRAQMDEMLSAGWELCLVCGEDDFAAWDREMTERLALAGIPKPRAVYFRENAFHISDKEEILRCGYTVAVHHGEDRLEMLNGDASAELWLVGAHPWNYIGITNDLAKLVSRGSELCFTVSFSEGREAYSPESFAGMMEYIGVYREKGSLTVTGFLAARDLHDPARNGANEAEERWLQEREELNEQIRILEEQIQEIYREWSEVLND